MITSMAIPALVIQDILGRIAALTLMNASLHPASMVILEVMCFFLISLTCLFVYFVSLCTCVYDFTLQFADSITFQLTFLSFVSDWGFCLPI